MFVVNNNMKKLPDSELEIMQVIWGEKPPISTGRVREILNERRKKDLNISTVQTLLNRLIKKEFLCAERIGKEKVYFPLVEEHKYLNFEAEHFIGKLFGNSLPNLVTTLYKHKSISQKDIEDIADWFSEQVKED